MPACPSLTTREPVARQAAGAAAGAARRELRDLLPAIGAYTLSFVILGRL
jgi:hypothetical protein